MTAQTEIRPIVACRALLAAKGIAGLRAPSPALPRYAGEGDGRCSDSVLISIGLDDSPD